MVKFLRKVRSMLIAMGGSLIPLAWSLVLMGMITYSVSVVILQGLAQDLQAKEVSAQRRLQWSHSDFDLDDGVFYWNVKFTRAQQMQTLYGGLFRAMLTCFRAVIGEIDFF